MVDISPNLAGLLGFFMLVVFLALGVPIGISMAVVGFLGMVALRGAAAFTTIYTIPYSAAASWALSVIPMFLLMGYMAFYAGFTKDAFEAAYRWVGRLPGGLAVASLIGAAIFGACSGSSVAATAALGKIALPEMERHGYSPRLAAGAVAIGATLDALIPPSILLVLYGIVTEESIGKLLLAGVLPGIVSMAVFIVVVLVWARVSPAAAPRGQSFTLREKLAASGNVTVIALIFVITIGGLYTGVFTPTEAGALGAFVTLVLALLWRRLKWANFREAVNDSLRVFSAIFLIVVGAYILIQFLAVSRLPIAFAEWAVHLPVDRMVVFAGLVMVYLILGCFLDALGLLLLTVPFVFPAVVGLGFNPIWFGVIVVKLIEIGLLTPPVGIQSYVLKGVAPHLKLQDIFVGFTPFVIVDIVVNIGLLTAFPVIALFLPNRMQ